MNPLVIAMLTVVAAPLLGGLLYGVDRRVSARMQGRVGPPLVQPFYDAIKLLAKEPIVVNRQQVVFAYAYLALTVTALLMLVLGQDLLLTVFVLGFAGVCFILGGFSTRSPYAVIGAQREIIQMLAYEPVLILLAVAVYLTTGSFMVTGILADSTPLLLNLPLAFLALLLVLTIKMRKSPFDFSASEHAHQELVRGITTEYAGPYLALIEITHWYELVIVLVLVGLFWATNLWAAAGLVAAAFLLELVIDNISPRMRWSWMVRSVWVAGIGALVLNIAVLTIA